MTPLVPRPGSGWSGSSPGPESGPGLRPGARRSLVRLPRWHRLLLYGAVAGLWVTGAAWLVFHFFVEVQGEFGPQPHWLESWWLDLHGLLVFVGLLVLGPLFLQHAPRGWKTRRSRRLGMTLVISVGWLVLSGYGLYYVPDLLSPGVLSVLHWVVGLAAPLFLVAHVWSGRRRRRGRRLDKED